MIQYNYVLQSDKCEDLNSFIVSNILQFFLENPTENTVSCVYECGSIKISFLVDNTENKENIKEYCVNAIESHFTEKYKNEARALKESWNKFINYDFDTITPEVFFQGLCSFTKYGGILRYNYIWEANLLIDKINLFQNKHEQFLFDNTKLLNILVIMLNVLTYTKEYHLFNETLHDELNRLLNN